MSTIVSKETHTLNKRWCRMESVWLGDGLGTGSNSPVPTVLFEWQGVLAADVQQSPTEATCYEQKP